MTTSLNAALSVDFFLSEIPVELLGTNDESNIFLENVGNCLPGDIP